MKLIVVAGGQGTKLWPMSRESRPKQFQTILGESSLFKLNVDTLLTRFAPQDIFISTKKMYASFVQADAPQIPVENLILEPDFKKNQGPATGYAVLKVAHKYPDEPFMIIQSDCVRLPQENYLNMIEGANKLVQADKRLITGGVRPVYPDMGSDYLRLGDKIKTSEGLEVYKIDKFIPRLGDYQKTRDLIENFHVSTHCNHHCWYADLLLESFKEFKPNWYEKFTVMREYFGTAEEAQKTNEIYEQLEAGPIEDVTSHIFEREGSVILLPFKWTDIGTWGSIYEYFAGENQVYKDGDIVDIECGDALIKGKKGKLIAAMGVDNIVIVDTEDVLFVCDRDRTGEIKKVIDQLTAKQLTQYL